MQLLALLSGTLTFEQGCLWISTSAGRYLPIWGPANALATIWGDLVVLQGGQVVAKLGQTVEVSGGEWPIRNAADLGAFTSSNGISAPQACSNGPFWLVGGVVEDHAIDEPSRSP